MWREKAVDDAFCLASRSYSYIGPAAGDPARDAIFSLAMPRLGNEDKSGGAKTAETLPVRYEFLGHLAVSKTSASDDKADRWPSNPQCCPEGAMEALGRRCGDRYRRLESTLQGDRKTETGSGDRHRRRFQPSVECSSARRPVRIEH
jgi:hypothetical protein